MFRVDGVTEKELQSLFRKLRRTAPETAKEIRRRFRAAAKPALATARAKQSKRSGELRRKTRIVTTSGVVAIRSSARHGRVSEFGGRHPLFGDREHWYPHVAVPAIRQAVDAHKAEFTRQANAALYTELRKAGFR